MTVRCCHHRPTSNYALRAGRILTAGGSRAQISAAEATGNAPSTTSKEGSRAAAIDLCRAEKKRLKQILPFFQIPFVREDWTSICSQKIVDVGKLFDRSSSFLKLALILKRGVWLSTMVIGCKRSWVPRSPRMLPHPPPAPACQLRQRLRAYGWDHLKSLLFYNAHHVLQC